MSRSLSAALRLDDDRRLPPAADIVVVRNQHAAFTIPVAGVPTGTTLVRFILTVKDSWRDLDTSIPLQKVVRVDTDPTVVGQIVDPGPSGIARVVVQLLPADLELISPDAEYQCWAEVEDSALTRRQGPCLMGAFRVRAPVPNVLP